MHPQLILHLVAPNSAASFPAEGSGPAMADAMWAQGQVPGLLLGPIWIKTCGTLQCEQDTEQMRMGQQDEHRERELGPGIGG